jgi:hypothetical protein
LGAFQQGPALRKTAYVKAAFPKKLAEQSRAAAHVKHGAPTARPAAHDVLQNLFLPREGKASLRRGLPLFHGRSFLLFPHALRHGAKPEKKQGLAFGKL